jgi:hypothetical protein
MTNPRLIEIKEKVATDPRWTERAILAIYKMQTREEQAKGVTKVHNGIGFTGPDGEIFSSFAQWIKLHGHLTPKQLFIAQKKMPKYAGQLCDIAEIPRTIKKPRGGPR